MNNEQIIQQIAAQIYGEDKVAEMLLSGQEIPLHTLKGWNQRKCRTGYRYKVKKGEHGIECRLWKKKKKKDKDQTENTENNEDKPDNRDFYLCKSFLFAENQVEEVKQEKKTS